MKRVALQKAFIDHYANVAKGLYPKIVKPYGGQLRDPSLIEAMPSLYITVRSGKSTAQTTNRKLSTYADTVEVIGFCENLSDPDQNYHEGLKLIDWIEEHTNGIITVDGQPVRIADEISFVGVEDVYPHYALIATIGVSAQ